jgi:hypothetical protein
VESDVLVLQERLTETMALLRRVEECHWIAWLQQSQDEIAQRKLHGLERLLGAYDGMGSFNDLFIHQINGYKVSERETASVNDKPDTLRHEMYQLAEKLRREAGQT